LWSNKPHLAVRLMNFISAVFGLLISISIYRFHSHVRVNRMLKILCTFNQDCL
jgi:hypothetical protein